MTTSTTGCGCHGTKAGTGSPAPSDPTAACGFTSLNPEDGLFLRAQHLSTIQDYARAFAMAVGQGAGAGVVYGYDLTLDTDGQLLTAGPGLAINELGQPLLSPSPVTVGLPTQAAEGSTTTYWVVRACPTSSLSGHENRYGSICDDPCCGDGASIQPFRCESVELTFQDLTADDLGRQEQAHRRSWLASYYYERERELSGPWLTRGTETALQQPRLARPWGTGNPAPLGECVPLGVLLLVDGIFVLDTWTARRDVGMGCADDTWRCRLGMRPWNVFMAQVLQFQDQLSGFVDSLANPEVVESEVTDPKAEVVTRFLESVRKRKGPTPEEVKEFQQAYAHADQPFVRLDSTTSLFSKGFDELPPAGFLPLPPDRDELERGLKALFAGRVDWRICSASADAIARAVDQAEHLDRIPLTHAKDRPQVDILVPDVRPDLAALETTYGWVAFVRRRELRCTETPDLQEVPVYLMEVDDTGVLERSVAGDRELRSLFVDAEATDATRTHPSVLEKPPIGTLLFPPDGWEYPGNTAALEMLQYDDREVLMAVALTLDADRRPLGALRAHLFLASFVEQRRFVPVEAVTAPAAPEEVIVIVVGSRRLVRLRTARREQEAEAIQELVGGTRATPAPRATARSASTATAAKKTSSRRTGAGPTRARTGSRTTKKSS